MLESIKGKAPVPDLIIDYLSTDSVGALYILFTNKLIVAYQKPRTITS